MPFPDGFDDDTPGRLMLRDDGVVVAEYVYAPTEPQLESPRPYALLRARDGSEVTAYRPDDHVWHKGLSLALPVVGEHNFWGGPTYVHGDGYVQLPNNGAQVHREVLTRGGVDGVARVDERLDWVSEGGDPLLAEHRTLTARVVDDATWALTWRSALRNVSASSLAFGSPTTKGRDNAGYAGIFWRGPESFTGGMILAPDAAENPDAPARPVGDAARGVAAPWLAFLAPDRSTGILMLDAAAADRGAGVPWFARSEEYAGLNPAPFFHAETMLPPGETLILAAALVVGNAEVAGWAPTVGAALVAELQDCEETP